MKWLCGFVNAQGGVLEVGRNDDGQVIGIENADRLMHHLSQPTNPDVANAFLGQVKWNHWGEGLNIFLKLAVKLEHLNP